MILEINLMFAIYLLDNFIFFLNHVSSGITLFYCYCSEARLSPIQGRFSSGTHVTSYIFTSFRIPSLSHTTCVFTPQFPNASEAHHAMGRRMLPNGDFTDELSMINQIAIFNNFENKPQGDANGNGAAIPEVSIISFIIVLLIVEVNLP